MTGFIYQRPLSSVGGGEVTSHRGGERVIFFMDYVMYLFCTIIGCHKGG